MEVHVFLVEVGLEPVVGRALTHELSDARLEVGRLQQDDLDDEVAHLQLVAFEAAQRLATCEHTRRLSLRQVENTSQ